MRGDPGVGELTRNSPPLRASILVMMRLAWIWIAAAAACGSPQIAPAPPAPPIAAGSAERPHRPDPELDPVPPPKLLSIDWATVAIGSDADALALWQRIAPTGADWQSKLFEVPGGPIAKALAIALLRAGNVACVRNVPTTTCGPIHDVAQPDDAATLADPCLRRQLALWSLDQLDDADLWALPDVARALATLPPPESELVERVMQKAEDDPDQDGHLALIAYATRAGQGEIAGAHLGSLDEAHLITAVERDRIASALDVLSADAHRDVYVKAIADEELADGARIRAIGELGEANAGPLPKDLREALVALTYAKRCAVAAAAIRVLAAHGDKRAFFAPPVTMHELCVVASYERLQAANESSPLARLVPRRGLELATTAYDPDAVVGSDGVDPRHTSDLAPPEIAVLPEIEDLNRAFAHCKGTICTSVDREYRFTLRGGLLVRIDVEERPPCQALPAP